MLFKKKHPKRGNGKIFPVKMTEFVIAIPSYKRADTLKNKTLNLLKKSDINLKEKVYIFVADEAEYEIYKQILNPDDYNSLIIGRPTLKNQRNFILDYFPLDKNIIHLDDDLIEVMGGFKDKTLSKASKEGGGDTPRKDIITKTIFSLNQVFISGFEECKKVKASIFGYYPVYNKFFMTNTISYNLSYIVGAVYGIINQREKQYVFTDDKEDFERSIKCFINDKKVIRFNFISFKTKYYKEPGGLQETRTLETIQKGAEYIVDKYPDFAKIKIKKNGIYEIVLKQPMGETPIPISLKIKKDFSLINLQYDLLKKLENTTINTCECYSDKKSSRTTLLLENPDHIQYKGVIDRPRTMTFGFGRRRTLGYGPLSPNSKHPELLKLLIEYGKMILPEKFIFTTITLNKNLKCKAHLDQGNFGVSALTTIGPYDKGGLFIEKKLYSTNNTILLFDGSKLLHETQEFSGDRYAIIYFKQNLKYVPNEFIFKGEKK